MSAARLASAPEILCRFSGGGDVKSTMSPCRLPWPFPLGFGLTGEPGGVLRLKKDAMEGLAQLKVTLRALTEPAKTPWAS